MTHGAARDRPVLRRLAGASAANLALQGISTLLSLAASLVLGNGLGAEGMGLYAFAITLATVLSVLTRLGLDSLLTREVAVAQATRAFSELAGIVRWGMRTSGLLAVGVGLLVAVVAGAVAEPRTAWVVGAAMAMLLPMTWLVVPGAVLRGLDRVVVANVPPLAVRPAVFLAALGGLALAGMADPFLAVMANGVAHGVALVAFAVPFWRHFPAEARQVEPEEHGRAYLAAAVPLMFLAALSMITVQSDVLMLKALATDADVGIYAVVAQLVRLIGLPLTVVNRVVAPRFATSFVQGDRAAMQRAAALTAAGITALTVPVALLLTWLAEPLLGMFGAAFTGGGSALRILVIGQVVNALCGSVGTVLLMVGRERELGIVSFAAAALNVLLNLVLIPRLGLEGAAWASSAALILFNVVLVVRVRRSMDLDTTILGLMRLWPRGGSAR